MGKFSANQRQLVGANCIAAMQGNKRRVRVYCSSKEGGELVAGIINAAYGYKCTKSENIFETVVSHVVLAAAGPAGTGAGLLMENWKNFSCDAKSDSNAKKLVKEINDCISEYGTGGDVDTSYFADEEPDASSGLRLGKTAIYLIIGVVVVVAAVIIIKRKKKK